MMTDGIFDVAYPWLLAKTDQPIYVNYVRPFMDINILKVSTPADFENAQTEITDFFKGPYSKQITDDKTIVGIINTDVIPEIKPDEFYAEPDWKVLAKEHHDRLYEHKSSENFCQGEVLQKVASAPSKLQYFKLNAVLLGALLRIASGGQVLLVALKCLVPDFRDACPAQWSAVPGAWRWRWAGPSR